MPRRLVIGDIHGQFYLLKDVLEKAKVDYENDFLIILGDVVDRGPEPHLCVEELIKIKHKVFILGNHDRRFQRYYRGEYKGDRLRIWEEKYPETYAPYQHSIPQSHIDFFESAVDYHVIDGDLFVHAGIDDEIPIVEQSQDILLKSREMVKEAIKREIKGFKRIFVGHTPTFKLGKPKGEIGFFHNVVAMDTGSFSTGVISIMDLDSEEFWQSNPELLKKY